MNGARADALHTPGQTGAKVLVLMYHHVGPFARPRSRKGLFCHVDRFRWQMRYLAGSNVEVISLQTAFDGLFHGAALPKKSIVLTFDDGYQDFYDHAWPVLTEHGLPVTVFAVAGRLGATADWLDGCAAVSTRLMTAETLRALARAGVSVGSHALTHPRLANLTPAARDREITASKARLEDCLGQPVTHFCYPYGHYDQATRDAVRRAGYLTGLTTRRERADRAANAFEIPRQGISYKDTRLHYAYKLGLKHARRSRSR